MKEFGDVVQIYMGLDWWLDIGRMYFDGCLFLVCMAVDVL